VSEPRSPARDAAPEAVHAVDAARHRAFFDDVARGYDRVFAPSHRDTAADLEAILASLTQGAVVVDAGCGTGRAWPHLLSRGARVVGLDASAEMLRVARGRASADGVARVRCDLGQRWPLRDGAADLVIALHASLAHPSGDPWAFFAHVGAELRRVLRPGGAVALDLPEPSFARAQLAPLGGDWYRFEAKGVAPVETFVPEPSRVLAAMGLDLTLARCLTGVRAYGAIDGEPARALTGG
jgi:SAM-dependent methyltransferase